LATIQELSRIGSNRNAAYSHFYGLRVFQPNELLGVARQPGAIAITSCKPGTDPHDAHLDYDRIADNAGVITWRLEGAT